jgi:hypothetical protein
VIGENTGSTEIDIMNLRPICVVVWLWMLSPEAAHSQENQFHEELIADGFGYAFAVAAADLDADGDLDLTACDTDNGEFYWFENDGSGKFQRRFVQRNEPGWFERHAIGDINGDGRLDIAVVKNKDGHLVWFEQTSVAGDEGRWKRHVITTDLMRAYDVVLVDLSGDGRLDAAASAWVGNHFAWFENPGADRINQTWEKRLIDENVAETRNIRVADFNADGRPDLLGTAHNAPLIAWYEQPADPASRLWIRHAIDDASPGPTHGHAVDMDGDQDADVVMSLGFSVPPDATDSHVVVWYENQGAGSEWNKHVVGPLNIAFEAVTGDLDADGDLDIAATGWGDPGSVVWFENSGDPRGEWRKHVLKDAWRRANQIILFDADRDGDLDIAATAERGTNELRLWRNQTN